MTAETGPMTRAERIAWARSRVPEYRNDQGALAKCVGVSRQTVSSWETDGSRPTGPRLKKLAKCLGVSERWIDYGPQSAVTTIPTKESAPDDDATTRLRVIRNVANQSVTYEDVQAVAKMADDFIKGGAALALDDEADDGNGDHGHGHGRASG